ncbi:MAG TPA: proteasome assembly chaperone 4 family protein [Selenomonadales bacterium]|nr:proteasome assembly chaperone 4 family protein [Selenomonadales bacterium]
MIEFERQSGRIRVSLRAAAMGADLCLIISGGDRPHLGAVALAQPRPSLAEPDRLSPSVSLLTLVGHKEGGIACQAAERIASRTGRNVVVCCGIHVDEIQGGEITAVLEMVNTLVSDLLNATDSELTDPV